MTAIVLSSIINPKTVDGQAIGYRRVPLTVQNGNYTAVATDSGRGIKHTDTTAYSYTINSGVFQEGDVVTVMNDTSTGAITIVQGAGMSLYTQGTTTLGNKTVPVRGIATIYFSSGSVAYVSGVT